MTDKIKIEGLLEFDIAESLDNTQAIADYLNIALEKNDTAVFIGTLRAIARAKGLAEIAEALDLTPEALSKELSPNANPRIDTIMKIIRALGVKLHAEPV